MSISTGGFTKPASNQNDGVVFKPLPSLILERFRAMVKEREEELRAFGAGAVFSLNMDEIVRIYEIVLSSLTFNSKPIINDLTIIAGEQRAHAEGIADAICARIIEDMMREILSQTGFGRPQSDYMASALYLPYGWMGLVKPRRVKNIKASAIHFPCGWMGLATPGFDKNFPIMRSLIVDYCFIWLKYLVPVDQKMPSLYLLDSIVKNIGKEYISYFSVRLFEVFCEAYAQVHPSMHSSMRHLFGTWSAVFPLSILRKIEAQLQFSPSLHGQSSGLSSSRVSESPRPTLGIHVNPKYLGGQHQFGHSSVDMVGAEGVSCTGRAGFTTSGLGAEKRPLSSAVRIAKSASPYSIGHGGSLLPSLEEFGANNSPRRLAVRASPSHTGIDYRLSRVMDIEEEINFNQHLKTSAYNFSNSIDLRGTRALINAYGKDEREIFLKPIHQIGEHLEGNSFNQKVARIWQNTEEEEFDWKDMTSALSDRSEIHSYHQYPGNTTTRQRFTPNYGDTFVSDYGGNRSKSVRGSIDKITGDLPTIVGTSESIILQPQQSKSHLNAKGGGFFSESRSSFTASEQKLPVIGHFPHTNQKFGGPSNAMSMFNSTNDSPAPEFRSANAEALAKEWRPTKLPSSHNFSLVSAPPQIQIRGQFGMGNAGTIITDQDLNKRFHSERYFNRPISMSQVYLPQVPSQRPGSILLNRQTPVQDSLVQSTFLMPQEVRQNIPPPCSASAPSHAMVPPSSYGYYAQGHGPHMQPPLPNINTPNMSYHIPGTAFPSQIRGPFPGKTPAFPIGQNIGQVASNPQSGGALSGLVGSLVSQGLVSLTKQDSVGLEFDQDSLKVQHESAISTLYADLPRQCTSCGLRFKSQDEHSKHMDWHVNKNRTLKNRKTKPSPKWFVTVTMWLSGAEALGTEAVPGFMPAENNVEKEEDEEMAVPADEDQNACSLCGEPFEDFYSDDTEEWMYKGATYMYAPPVLTVGMDRSKLGPIVHAKCRSDSHRIPSEDFTKEKGGSVEEGKQRKRLRS